MYRVLTILVLSLSAAFVALQPDLSALSSAQRERVAECRKNLTAVKDEDVVRMVIQRKKPKTDDDACFLTCLFSLANMYDFNNDSVMAAKYRERINARNANGTEPDYKIKMEIVDYCETKIVFRPKDDCNNVRLWVSCCADERELRNVTTGLW